LEALLVGGFPLKEAYEHHFLSRLSVYEFILYRFNALVSPILIFTIYVYSYITHNLLFLLIKNTIKILLYGLIPNIGTNPKGFPTMIPTIEENRQIKGKQSILMASSPRRMHGCHINKKIIFGDETSETLVGTNTQFFHFHYFFSHLQ